MEEDKKNFHRIKFLDYKAQSGITYYSISVTNLTTSESWIFESRYRNMLDIHNLISNSLQIKLPTFPPKKWPGNMNPDFISQRQKSLENYFNNLLKVVSLENLPILKNFLYQSYKKKEEKAVFKAANPISEPKYKQNQRQDEEKNNQDGYNQNFLKPTFEKIVESVKFVDLNTNLSSPEEEEVKEKKENYSSVILNLKLKLPKKAGLPEVKSLVPMDEINKQNTLVKNAALIYAINNCMESLVEQLCSGDHLIFKSQVIHCFQSA